MNFGRIKRKASGARMPLATLGPEGWSGDSIGSLLTPTCSVMNLIPAKLDECLTEGYITHVVVD